MKKLDLKKNWKSLLLGAAFLLAFYTVIYSDILITVQNALNLIDFALEGRIGDFYTESFGRVVNLGFDTGDWVFYDFPLYIIFAVWNFPLWLVSRLGGVEILYSPLCVMWAKSMLLPFLWLAAKAMDGICRSLELDARQIRLNRFLFFTSGMTVSAICLLSQYDIIGISLMLWGIKAYMEEDTKKFLLFFALSVPMKFFTLLAFVPLVLLKEKRVWHILGQFACSVSLLLVCRVLLSASTDGDALFWFLFKNTMRISVGTLFFFVFAMVILVLVCYFKPYVPGKRQNEWAVYLCLASYGIFFATAYTYPYWNIFMVPFISLLIAKNSRFLRVNLITDLVLTYGMLLAYVFEFSWCYGGDTCSSMLLNFLQKGQRLDPIWDSAALLKYLFPGQENAAVYVIGLGVSAFIAALLVFMTANNPALSDKLPLLESSPDKPESFFVALRLLAAAGICCVPVAFYLMTFIM